MYTSVSWLVLRKGETEYIFMGLGRGNKDVSTAEIMKTDNSEQNAQDFLEYNNFFLEFSFFIIA